MTLFESKVYSALNKGMWLYALAPSTPELLNKAFDRWALLLLGGDWWRNAALCRSELSWALSGEAPAVKCVALRRARLHALPDEDWYKSYFLACQVQAILHKSCCFLFGDLR